MARMLDRSLTARGALARIALPRPSCAAALADHLQSGKKSMRRARSGCPTQW